MTSPLPEGSSRYPFGTLLRKLRIAAGLSQELLAEKAHISHETIGALERGRRKAPQRETLALISAALKLSPLEREQLEAAARISRPPGQPKRFDQKAAGARAATGLQTAPRIAPKTNLPYATSSFHGRERHLTELTDALNSKRIVTLVGPGGVGKTRLALEVARHQLAGNAFPDGVWVVDLAAIDDAGLVTASFASSLGIGEEHGEAFLQTISAALGDRRVLLVVDNCEHLLDRTAFVIERLSQTCPGVGVIGTSREALNIDGEFVYRVDPLELPALDATTGTLTIDQLKAAPAAQLFIARAADADPEHFAAAAAAHPAAVAGICTRLDGLPLALELAAARIPELSLRDILAGLDNRFALLRRGRRLAQPRQQTLRGMLGWSYDLLPSSEQQLFRRLGIFAAAWTRATAAAICCLPARDEEPLTEQAVDDGIAALVAKSLVAVERDEAGRAPYRLLESMRYYARELLRESAEYDAVARRHAQHFRAALEHARPPTGESITVDYYDLHAALDWTLGSRNDIVLGVQMVRAVIARWTSARASGEVEPGDPDEAPGRFGLAHLLELPWPAHDGLTTRANRLADGSAPVWRRRLATERTYRAGERIFRVGDIANELFSILSGTVLLEEFNIRIGANDLLGEVAFFSPAKRRTASAVCVTAVRVSCIGEDHIPEMFACDPELRVDVLHVLTKRMIADLQRAETASRTAAADSPPQMR